MINNFRDEYAFLSNFFEAPVVFNGLQYKNNEAAFQSAKTRDLGIRMRFAKLDPSQAKAQGRALMLRPDWEQVKLQIMHQICYSKFTFNPELGEKLLATGNEYLEEGNTWGDTFWGTVNGHGQNWLGKILMRVREELRQGARFYPVKVVETRTKTIFVPAGSADEASKIASRLYDYGVLPMHNTSRNATFDSNFSYSNDDVFQFWMTGERYDTDGEKIVFCGD